MTTKNLPALRNGPPMLAQMEVKIKPEQIDWDNQAELPSYNANQATVSQASGQIHLTFYEVVPPSAFTAKQRKAINSFRARGQVRVILSPESAAQVAMLLAQHTGRR